MRVLWSHQARSATPIEVARLFARELFCEPREIRDISHAAYGDDGSFCGSFWLVGGVVEYRIRGDLAGNWEVWRAP